LLEQNYRSKQIVLDAARAVIDLNRNRTPKKLFTQRGEGDKIVLYEAPDDHSEAAYVVETIQRQMSSGGKKGGEFAVMYRTNAQSRLLEDAFMRAGMPYRLVGAQRFYGRREIKDLIAYLRVIHNPADEISLDRIINVPARKIGSKTVSSLKKIASQMGVIPAVLLLDLGQKVEKSIFWEQFTGREAAALTGFGQLFAGWRAAAGQIPLHELIERILADIGFQAYLDSGSEEGLDRWANVEEFLRLALEFEERGLGLVEFLENLALVSDQDTLPDKYDAPTLLTLHAAKGLEFGQVFLVGLDDGLLPHTRSINSDDPEEMAEERRLFYVGITRTKNQLYFVRATRRTTYGSSYFSTPCRFLDDIPDELMHMQGVRSFASSSGRSWRQDAYTSQTRWEHSVSTKPTVTHEPKFAPNMHVNHPVWGEGMVLESRIDEGDELVDVHFESVGFKRLLASLAKLEIID
jgi:DNA helicase-2/ATP-dependent DNA helicase PcrA